jgi:hypothetical protein
MTNFANFDLDRRPITKQFGPLTGYRKEEEGYMDVKMMFFGRSWSRRWLGRRDLTRGLQRAR